MLLQQNVITTEYHLLKESSTVTGLSAWLMVLLLMPRRVSQPIIPLSREYEELTGKGDRLC